MQFQFSYSYLSKIKFASVISIECVGRITTFWKKFILWTLFAYISRNISPLSEVANKQWKSFLHLILAIIKLHINLLNYLFGQGWSRWRDTAINVKYMFYCRSEKKDQKINNLINKKIKVHNQESTS